MRRAASPAFTIRIADIVSGTVQLLLDLRLYFPGEFSTVGISADESHEYLLHNTASGLRVHFLIEGIKVSGEEQLHRFCVNLYTIRNSLYDSFINVLDESYRQ